MSETRTESRLKEVTLDSLNQGRAAVLIDQHLADLARALMAMRDRVGRKVKSSKAKLAVEIEMESGWWDKAAPDPYDVDQELQAVTVTIKPKRPPEPPLVSLATVEANEDGELSLFVDRSGSRADTPRQMVLCKDDGTPIDGTGTDG